MLFTLLLSVFAGVTSAQIAPGCTSNPMNGIGSVSLFSLEAMFLDDKSRFILAVGGNGGINTTIGVLAVSAVPKRLCWTFID